jgi:hypothetical protein
MGPPLGMNKKDGSSISQQNMQTPQKPTKSNYHPTDSRISPITYFKSFDDLPKKFDEIKSWAFDGVGEFQYIIIEIIN